MHPALAVAVFPLKALVYAIVAVLLVPYHVVVLPLLLLLRTAVFGLLYLPLTPVLTMANVPYDTTVPVEHSLLQLAVYLAPKIGFFLLHLLHYAMMAVFVGVIVGFFVGFNLSLVSDVLAAQKKKVAPVVDIKRKIDKSELVRLLRSESAKLRNEVLLKPAPEPEPADTKPTELVRPFKLAKPNLQDQILEILSKLPAETPAQGPEWYEDDDGYTYMVPGVNVEEQGARMELIEEEEEILEQETGEEKAKVVPEQIAKLETKPTPEVEVEPKEQVRRHVEPIERRHVEPIESSSTSEMLAAPEQKKVEIKEEPREDLRAAEHQEPEKYGQQEGHPKPPQDEPAIHEPVLAQIDAELEGGESPKTPQTKLVDTFRKSPKVAVIPPETTTASTQVPSSSESEDTSFAPKESSRVETAQVVVSEEGRLTPDAFSTSPKPSAKTPRESREASPQESPKDDWLFHDLARNSTVRSTVTMDTVDTMFSRYATTIATEASDEEHEGK